MTIVQVSDGQISGHGCGDEERRSCSGHGRPKGTLGRPNVKLDRLEEGE